MSAAYRVVYVLATIWIEIHEKFPVSLGLEILVLCEERKARTHLTRPECLTKNDDSTKVDWTKQLI